MYLRAAKHKKKDKPTGGWRSMLSVFPAVGLAITPLCPICISAYVALFSALGVGVFNYGPYLMPLTVVFLIIAVLSLAFPARRRRDYRKFILGLLAAIAIVVGKFYVPSRFLNYGGIALLIGASLWNAWPKRRKKVDLGSTNTNIFIGKKQLNE